MRPLPLYVEVIPEEFMFATAPPLFRPTALHIMSVDKVNDLHVKLVDEDMVV